MQNKTWASWRFRNVFFMSEMLEAHIEDMPEYKGFHNPEEVLILHNHYPLACLGWKLD